MVEDTCGLWRAPRGELFPVNTRDLAHSFRIWGKTRGSLSREAAVAAGASVGPFFFSLV